MRFMTPSPETKKPLKGVKYLSNSEGALRNGSNFIFYNMEKPILPLVFDIGAKTIQSPLVKVSHSEKPLQILWLLKGNGQF